MNRLVFGAGATMAAVLVASGAWAQSALTLTATTGHPSGSVVASASGFGASEAVDLYFDTADTELLVSSSSGVLTGTVAIPASAAPGVHYITAVGRRSGDAAQAAYTVSTPWTQYGYGIAHRGMNPYENTLTTSNVKQLGEVWQAKIEGSGATPAIVDGIVYTSTFQGVQARLASTGALKWSALPTSSFYASPAVVGATVYVASNSNYVSALATLTGKPRWSVKLGGSVLASPVVSNGKVYVGCEDGKLYALQASSGTTIWSYTTGAAIDSTPVVVDGVVYFGSTDKSLYALDATTGALIFSYATGGLVESAPSVANGVVYFGSDDANIYALSTSSGSLIWTYKTGGVVYDAPAVSDGMVFEGSSDGSMYALDLGTGSLRWSASLGGVVRSASVANGVVYATSQGGLLYMLDENYGGAIAKLGLGFDYFGAPAISDGYVYLDPYQGSLYSVGLLGQTNLRRGGPPLPASLRPNLNLSARR